MGHWVATPRVGTGKDAYNPYLRTMTPLRRCDLAEQMASAPDLEARHSTLFRVVVRCTRPPAHAAVAARAPGHAAPCRHAANRGADRPGEHACGCTSSRRRTGAARRGAAGRHGAGSQDGADGAVPRAAGRRIGAAGLPPAPQAARGRPSPFGNDVGDGQAGTTHLQQRSCEPEDRHL